MAKRKSTDAERKRKAVEDQKATDFGEFKPPKKREDFNSKMLKKPKIQRS